MSNWAYNLDMLAQNGVLDFDAPSFVMGQSPRYVGSPSTPPSPYVGSPLPNAPALTQPQIDEFRQEKQKVPKKENENNGIVKNPSWKKWLFGAIAVGALIFGACKFKSLKKWVKDIPSKFSKKFEWSNIKKYCKDKAKSVGKFFEKSWKKFTGMFKKKP